MKQEKIVSDAKKTAARVYDAANALRGDVYDQVGGTVRQAKGQAQAFYAEATDVLEDNLAARPIAVLAVAVGLGFVVGALMARRPASAS